MDRCTALHIIPLYRAAVETGAIGSHCFVWFTNCIAPTLSYSSSTRRPYFFACLLHQNPPPVRHLWVDRCNFIQVSPQQLCSFYVVRPVQFLVGRANGRSVVGWQRAYKSTYWAPSSPRPIGNSRTFTLRLSAKVRVTGIDPPSRVKSGLLLYTASVAFFAAS